VATAQIVATADIVLAAVDRLLEQPALRARAFVPMHDQTADFTRLAEIQVEMLLHAARRIAAPSRLHVAIDRRGWRRICPRTACARTRAQRRRVGRRQFAERELIEFHRPFAAVASGADDELDRCGMLELAIGGWPPRTFDLAFLDDDLPPLVRECVIRLVEPPYVVATRIAQLELQIVDRRPLLAIHGLRGTWAPARRPLSTIPGLRGTWAPARRSAAYPERKLVVGRQIQRQVAMRRRIAIDRVAVRIDEIEIQAQRLAGLSVGLTQIRTDVVRMLDLPRRDAFEVIEHARCCGCPRSARHQ